MLTASTPAGATPARIVAAMALSAPVEPSDPDEVEPVPGEDFVPPAARPDPEAKFARRPAAKADWPEAGAAEVVLPAAQARSAGAARTRAGSLPVWVAATGQPGPEKVKVEIQDRAVAEKSGVSGLLLSVKRTDGRTERGPVTLTVDYSAFKGAYGGDWASRLRLAPAPGDPTPVTAVRNDLKAGTVSAQVSIGDAASTLALSAAAEGSKGDYKATSLAPSGMWQVSTQSGDFSWSYPIRTPPVPGELVPKFALSYSSGAVDGRTVSTNNQPSWIGEGWNLTPGFIERAYKSCAEDLDGNNGKIKTGDMCWETDNATMSFGKISGRMVFENNVWRPKNDDGTRVERVTRNDPQANGDDNGEYWKVTTTDGTQYYFGLNRLPGWRADRPAAEQPTTQSTWTMPVFGNDTGEPCRATTFAASACKQAYRWNLDYVVDAHGNSMTYFYNQETNKYAQNKGQTTATYVRGGTLARIEYGTRAGQEYSGQAPARVMFESADRCLPGQNCATHTSAVWPDVPWDTECTTATCGEKQSPTFWSTKRLAKITTQISAGNGAYRDVDRWELAHAYPPADDGTEDSALWLNGITHTGLAKGTPIALGAVGFDGTMMPNRVNYSTDGGLPALNKPRITRITSESGSATDVSYAPPECAQGNLPTAAETNTMRCFPVKWAMPPASEPVNDWFHKYVVAKVVEDDLLTDSKDMVTRYEYDTVKGGAWAYGDDPLVEEKKRTWSEWRGYERVVVREGDPANDENKPETRTAYLYFRGMNGDRLNPAGGTKPVKIKDSTGTEINDDEPLSGFLREEITYDGSTPLTTEINEPSTRLTATQGTFKAYQVEVKRVETRERRADGTYLVTQQEKTYDQYGNETQVNDFGDVSKTDDDQCTTTTYVHNPEKLLFGFPSTATTVAVACGATASYPDDVISDTRLSYDGQKPGEPPLKGDVTTSEEARSYTGSTPEYLVTEVATFDAYGRKTESKDKLERTTSTAYKEVNGLTTETAVTNAADQVATTTFDPAWGSPVTETDTNNRRTSLTYDALGRLVKVYKPGRTEADGDPDVTYEYGVNRGGGPNWTRTSTLKANGNQVVSYQLLDGFLRPRQTQAPSPGGGRIVTDTQYDSRGLVSVNRPAYHATGDPGTTLYSLANTEAGKLPPATVTTYDGTERRIAEIYLEHNAERWRTTTSYGPDWVTTIPPEGGTVTTKRTDVRDRVIALEQYQGRTPTGTPDVTRYAYTKGGDLAKVTDAAGNVWRYTYDVLGRRTRSEDPDRGTSTMTYDDADQLLTTTDARGKTVASVYDRLGRVVETRLGSQTGTLLTKVVYDRGDLVSSTRYVNGQAYVSEVTGYDGAGRPKGTKVTIPSVEGGLAGEYTTTMTYAADGSLDTKTLPKLGDLAAETLDYDYNELGRLTTLKNDEENVYLSNATYTQLGEVAQVQLGTGDKRLWRTTYYEDGTRRVSETLTEREQAGRVPVNDLTYGYDDAGNVTRITDGTAGQTKDTQCFKVDHLRRVTEAWTQNSDTCAATPSEIGGPAPYWHQYTYDLIGNRTTKTVKGVAGAADVTTTYSYPEPGDGVVRPHAVTATVGATSGSYAYDAAGNTTSRPGPNGTQSLVWDDEGLLESVTAGGKSTSYLYDVEGEQLIRRDPGSVTLFVGDGELRLNTATGSKTGTRYYEGLGTRTGDGLTWTVEDHHGTSQVAVNATTLAVTTRRMDLFGNPRGAVPNWPAGSRGFVGGTLNADTGLTRLGAREYDPASGRFVSVDPIIDPYDPQQMNAYAYANNNPATMSDPDGEMYLEGDYGRKTIYTKPKPRKPKKPKKPKSVAYLRDFGGRCEGGRDYCRNLPLIVAQKRAARSRAAQHDWNGPDGARGRVGGYNSKPIPYHKPKPKDDGCHGFWGCIGSGLETLGGAMHDGAMALGKAAKWVGDNFGTVIGVAGFGICIFATAGLCTAAGAIAMGISFMGNAYDCASDPSWGRCLQDGAHVVVDVVSWRMGGPAMRSPVKSPVPTVGARQLPLGQAARRADYRNAVGTHMVMVTGRQMGAWMVGSMWGVSTGTQWHDPLGSG
ncbi:RHS repeat-associated core domain-containing protein [Nonomuraea sp. NPDC050786]|uniref:RHS repeat-associated core domain-containing protein n=1 Tax=Nonomuraea sp. NPDC050786 TaxID=3154840 RepID=UPI0033DEDA52